MNKSKVLSNINWDEDILKDVKQYCYEKNVSISKFVNLIVRDFLISKKEIVLDVNEPALKLLEMIEKAEVSENAIEELKKGREDNENRI